MPEAFRRPQVFKNSFCIDFKGVLEFYAAENGKFTLGLLVINKAFSLFRELLFNRFSNYISAFNFYHFANNIIRGVAQTSRERVDLSLPYMDNLIFGKNVILDYRRC